MPGNIRVTVNGTSETGDLRAQLRRVFLAQLAARACPLSHPRSPRPSISITRPSCERPIQARLEKNLVFVSHRFVKASGTLGQPARGMQSSCCRVLSSVVVTVGVGFVRSFVLLFQPRSGWRDGGKQCASAFQPQHEAGTTPSPNKPRSINHHHHSLSLSLSLSLQSLSFHPPTTSSSIPYPTPPSSFLLFILYLILALDSSSNLSCLSPSFR